MFRVRHSRGLAGQTDGHGTAQQCVTSSDHFDTSAAAHQCVCVHVKESPRHDIVIDVTTDPREDWAQAQARAAICVQPVDAHVCPAIRKPTRISLRSSSTHDPSDPPPRVVLTLTDLHAAAAEMTVQVVLFYRHCGIYRQIPVAMVRLRRAFTRERESLNRLTTVARQWLSRPVDDESTVWGRYPTVSIFIDHKRLGACFQAHGSRT